MAIKCIKMITGEELIADVDFKDNHISVSQPFILSMMKDPSNPDGDPQLGLFPYVPYVLNHTIIVAPERIIWAAELPESMIKDYHNAKYNLEKTKASLEVQ